MITPERYVAAARTAERRAAARRRRSSPTSTPATRPRSASSAGSTSTISSGGAPTRSSATPTSPPRNAGASAISSSTSSRTPRRSRLRLLRAWLGDRPDLVRRRRRRAGDLRVRGRRRVAAHRVRPPLPRRPHDRARAQLPLDRRDRRRRRSRARAGVRRRARRAACGATRATAPPTIVAFDDDARGGRRTIADACWHEFTDGVPWHRMAILFRTNAQSSLVRDRVRAAAASRSALTGAQRFAARPAVRVLLDRLREAERDAPDAVVHRAPRRSRRRRRRRSRRRAPTTEAPRRPASRGRTADDELRTHRDALLRLRPRLRRGRERGPGRSPASSRGSSSRRAAEQADERGVDLVTFHRAKGLEWQVVFVTGLERGLVPISWAPPPTARAEERRLLHVALGRAEDWLHCSWARERTASRPPVRAPAESVARRARAGDRGPAGRARRPAGAHRRRARHARARRRRPQPTSHARRARGA